MQVSGFFTVYRFQTLPETTRLRLSQLVVLFPYRRRGHASAMLDAMRTFALQEKAVRRLDKHTALLPPALYASCVLCVFAVGVGASRLCGQGTTQSLTVRVCVRPPQVDYTVEDPTDAFQKRRDVSDVAAARKVRIF